MSRRPVALVVLAASACAEPSRPAPNAVTRPALNAPPPSIPASRAVVPTVAAFGGDDEICAVKAEKIICTKSRIAIAEPMRGVSLGSEFGCGLAVSGNLYCWGRNTMGQLGLGRESASEPPTRVPLPRPVVDVAVQGSDTCAITDDGALHCWSAAIRGRGPARVETPRPVADVDACAMNHCGVLRGGGLYAVQITGTGSRGPVAVSIPGTSGFQTASFALQDQARDAEWAVCGVRKQRIECAGTDGFPDVGRLAHADGLDRFAGITAFSAYPSAACAITVEGDVQCITASVGRVPGLRDARSLHVSVAHTCAQMGSEQVRCFDAHDLANFEDVYDPFGPGPPKH